MWLCNLQTMLHLHMMLCSHGSKPYRFISRKEIDLSLSASEMRVPGEMKVLAFLMSCSQCLHVLSFSMKLKEIMENITFHGISGLVQFKGNNRISNFSVGNYISGEVHQIGGYDIDNKKVYMYEVPVWGKCCDNAVPPDQYGTTVIFGSSEGIYSSLLLY